MLVSVPSTITTTPNERKQEQQTTVRLSPTLLPFGKSHGCNDEIARATYRPKQYYEKQYKPPVELRITAHSKNLSQLEQAQREESVKLHTQGNKHLSAQVF